MSKEVTEQKEKLVKEVVVAEDAQPTENLEVEESKKTKVKKVAKAVGVGLAAVGIGFLGFILGSNRKSKNIECNDYEIEEVSDDDSNEND